jgi:hypothetical protein
MSENLKLPTAGELQHLVQTMALVSPLLQKHGFVILRSMQPFFEDDEFGRVAARLLSALTTADVELRNAALCVQEIQNLYRLRVAEKQEQVHLASGANVLNFTGSV